MARRRPGELIEAPAMLDAPREGERDLLGHFVKHKPTKALPTRADLHAEATKGRQGLMFDPGRKVGDPDDLFSGASSVPPALDPYPFMLGTVERAQKATGTERAHLREVRASIRSSAREVEDLHLGELDRAGVRQMAAPPPLVKDAKRLGGRYRSTGASDYDWFYSLHPAEQRRLREGGWFSGERAERGTDKKGRPIMGYTGKGGMSPDEVAERMPLGTWLDHTRRVDATRALGNGLAPEARRYGGLNPNHLIEGAPYDVRAIWGDDDRAAEHLRRAKPKRERTAGEHVEFFTDKEGIVHPIRASYEGRDAADAPDPHDYGADEDF